jgi:hypothetical protein
MTGKAFLILIIVLPFLPAQIFYPFDSKPYITPTDSMPGSVYINWNTAAAESTIVACGMTLDLPDTVRVPGTCNFHHARIRGLVPGADYYYRVLPAGDLKKFRTFAVSADSFSFALIGDTRTDSASHQAVIDRMAGYHSDFILHVGDYVYYGDSAVEWQTFFNAEDTVLQDRLILPAIGNHEDPYWPFDTLFALPDTGGYYSVDYANAHFAVLNSSADLYNAQRVWLRDDLAAAQGNPQIDWIIMALHRPAYSSGPHGSQADIQDAWCPLFDTNRVDVVFAGHDHDYERTIPLGGVTYVVTGGGGAPLHTNGYNSWTAYSESTYQFCLVKIRGLTLSLYSIRPDGSVCDSLIVDKIIGTEEAANRAGQPLKARPNPFKNSITIEFGKGLGPGVIGLKIYDISGRLVKTLKTNDSNDPEPVVWTGTNESGVPVPSGIYFFQMEAADQQFIIQIIKAE